MTAGWLSWRDLRRTLAAPATSGPFRSHRTTVLGIRTHYRAATTTPGTPVVLLHGLAVSHRYLMPTALALAAHRPVYVPDLPGFGLTGKPPTVYDPDRHAAHVAALLDALGVGPACLVGHSFGAEVAARLAAERPDAVTALVLAGPTADPAARSYRGQVGRGLVDLFGEDPRQAVILARDVRDAGPRRVLATLRASVHNAIERDLARVTVPTLLLRGRRDPIAPNRWLAEAARICGGDAEWDTVPGAHNALTTAGPQAAERIETFLARPARTPGHRRPGSRRPVTDRRV